MRRIFLNYFFIVVGIFAVTLAGCSGEAGRTGFLQDYSKLQPHPAVDGRFHYINQNIDATRYSKFIVDPVAINLSEKGQERNIDVNDLNSLARYFGDRIAAELRKGYQVVSTPGPDVMRVRASISEIDKTTRILNIHPGTKITGAGLGGAGAEMELVDSVTGELIAAAIDNQKGSRLDMVGGLQKFGHAQAVIENWAKDLKTWVNQVHGRPTN